jgi:phage tail sheath protein FI
MPEYLSPGVYLEEPDVGIRPIEGVSTSTAGMVGNTERGPVNTLMVVTSYPEYRRVFGGPLDFDVYGDDSFLPLAVEGFFTNGGRRLFVCRIAADRPGNVATRAAVTLFDRGDASGFADTRLLIGAREGDAFLFVEETAGLAAPDTVRIGDGTLAEYGELSGGVESAADRLVALRVPLYNAFLAGATVDELTLAAVAGPGAYASTLDGSHGAGSRTLRVAAAPGPGTVTPGAILQLGTANETEYVIVESVTLEPAGPRIGLAHATGRPHADADPVELVEVTGAPANSTVLSNAAGGGDTFLLVDDAEPAPGAFGAGAVVRVEDAVVAEYHRLSAFHPMALSEPLSTVRSVQDPVTAVTTAPTAGADALATTLTATAAAGQQTVLLAAVGTLAQGHFIRLEASADPNEEFAQVLEVNGNAVTFAQPLARTHANGAAVERIDVTAGVATELTQAAAAGDTTVFLAVSAGFGAGTLVQIGDPADQNVEFRALANPGAIGIIPLANPLVEDHTRGALFGRRDPLLTLEALDVGDWGNELRVVVDDDSLATTTVSAFAAAGLPVPLTSVAGIYEGTVLDFDGRLARVDSITGNEVVIATAGPPFALNAGDTARTREFQLRVEWVKNERVYEDQTVRALSLNPLHPRYLEAIVGEINGPLNPADRRPVGQSDYVRADDLAAPAVAETAIRLGPDILREPTFGGRLRAVGRFLSGGTNPPAGIVADTYIGQDDVDPDQRTGLQALRNENRISIVAIPGRSDQAVQQALIDHCELMRYRFCVLDSLPGSDRVRGAGINEVIAQRNLYDSRYAALYYPWFVIRNPNAGPGDLNTDLQIPPAGHILGIYARTDNERGVHKAPANVVVRGILALQRKLNQGEQDLLNPSPTNVNVSRDFSEIGRSRRVWGARCITSDTPWRYVNVRRLFIFLEQSMDEGTQWVVFEPNAEPLWARVRQSISAFLTSVWRDGALEGTKPEEAFFVRCDRTTMTQDDINNGRLIVLVGVAPVKPAEFVIIRVFQTTREALTT